MTESAATASDTAFFTRDGEWFRPTPHSRGPWDPTTCHAGPPTGLLARAAEHALPGHRLTRIVVDLTRPIPFDGFRIECEVVREGRRVSATQMNLVDGNERSVVTARTLHIGVHEPVDYPTTKWTPPSFAESRPGRFPLENSMHDLPGFVGDGIEVRYPPGYKGERGPTTMWMRTVPLLADEESSPFQRICPLADCGNAISANAPAIDFGAINPDLTLVLHRDPVGEWFGSQSQSHWQLNGVGMSDSLLFDEQGAVGRALQTLAMGT